jgi:hypothetical protein
MYYNGGTANEEEFGLCDQVGIRTEPFNMLTECNIQETYKQIAEDIRNPGKLNINFLSNVSSKIGKLTFCTPHAHGMSSTNGVNVHLGYDNDGKSCQVISNNLGAYGWTGEGGDVHYWYTKNHDFIDQTLGIAVSDHLYKYPFYNLVLNTKLCLE